MVFGGLTVPDAILAARHGPDRRQSSWAFSADVGLWLLIIHPQMPCWAFSCEENWLYFCFCVAFDLGDIAAFFLPTYYVIRTTTDDGALAFSGHCEIRTIDLACLYDVGAVLDERTFILLKIIRAKCRIVFGTTRPPEYSNIAG